MSRRQRMVLILAYITAAIVAVFAVKIAFYGCGFYRIIFADVGQGDASVILTNHYQTVLIDGGTRQNGKYALADILRENGITKVSAVFISHMQEDHIGGIEALIDEKTNIERIYVGDRAQSSDGFSAFERKAKLHGIPISVLSEGDIVNVDGAVFTVLSTGCETSSDENDTMQVIRCDIGESSVLFCGDATKRLEARLIANPLSDTDILKVPHHGSFYSSSEEFFDAVSPSLSVISVGANNSYKHPSDKTLKALSDADSAVLRTDLDGSITVILTEEDILDIRTDARR